MNVCDKIKFNSDGLVPAIIQDKATGRVLMMAWMNRASLETTIATGKTHFWSRSRQKFWMKGESSGHIQTVKDIAFDCDGDVLLIQVEQNGPAESHIWETGKAYWLPANPPNTMHADVNAGDKPIEVVVVELKKEN